MDALLEGRGDDGRHSSTHVSIKQPNKYTALQIAAAETTASSFRPLLAFGFVFFSNLPRSIRFIRGVSMLLSIKDPWKLRPFALSTHETGFSVRIFWVLFVRSFLPQMKFQTGIYAYHGIAGL